MIRANFLSRPTQALLACIGVLAIIVTLQLSFPAAPSLAGEAQLSEGEVSLPEFGSAALRPPAMTDLGDMLDRPLFFANRRLPEPPVVEKPPPPPKPLRLKLQGVALAGGSRVAVLRNTSNKLLLQLVEGEMHAGWTLDEVTSTTARFSKGEQVTELLLDPDAGDRRR